MIEEVRPQPLQNLEPQVQTPLAIPYSEELVEHFCDYYAQGLSIKKVCDQPGMPRYTDVTKWLRNVEGFRQAIDRARAARGIILEDKIMEDIDVIPDKDQAAGKRLQFDKLKWAAEMNDPATYGKRVTHAGDASKPITFVISTGFPEPNKFQQPPKLGADGLIEKEVKSEVIDQTERLEPNPPEATGLGLPGVPSAERGIELPQGSTESAGTQNQLSEGAVHYDPKRPWDHPAFRGQPYSD